MPPPPFCTGYHRRPYMSLVADVPGPEVFPPREFRVEWGPIFHRGRLDGTARVLVLGQDPGASEAIARRVLVGTAGQRVQGLLAKLGVESEYVCLNAFAYSVYGQHAAEANFRDERIMEYRNRWLDAIVAHGRIRAVIAFGQAAEIAYELWSKPRDRPIAFRHLYHPTYPEAAAAAGGDPVEVRTRKLLRDWNVALAELHPLVAPAGHELEPYGDAFTPADLPSIPAFDLPAGTPAWWRSPEPWAARTGDDPETKRRTLTVTVPRSVELPG